MEKYRLHMHRAAFDRVQKCMSSHIEQNKWLPVEVLSNIFGSDLSSAFGNGHLGWSPTALLYGCTVSIDKVRDIVVVSMPKPEEIPACSDGRTVRDRMEELAGCERPTLKDWLNKNGIHTGANPSPYKRVYMHDTLASLRSFVENGYSLYPELVEQLTEMRTLIHALIGTGENCDGAPDNEYPEAVRKATRLDAMDALSYAIQAMFANKGMPGVKTALNSIYGTAAYDGVRLDDALKRAEKSYVQTVANVLNGNPEEQAVDSDQLHTSGPENVRDEEPPALFVTIETGTFEVTPENVGAVSTFISNAGEGRDIHLRII